MINRTPWGLGLLLFLLATPAQAARGDRENEALANIGDRFAGAENAMPVTDDAWWESFGIPELDAVMDQGLAANPDVNAATAQFEQALYQARQSYGVLMPTISANASVNGSPEASFGAGNPFFADIGSSAPPGQEPEPNPNNIWTGSATLNANWQIDLWGRNTLLWLSNQKNALASAASADGQRLTISTTIAGAWFDVVLHQQRVAVVEDQIQTAEAVLELTELRYERGDSTALDVLQQRQQLASTRALLPQSRTLLRFAEQQLAVLLARSPNDGPEVLAGTLPELSVTPAVGTPEMLVDRAPAVVAAKAQLVSAERQLQAAWRAPLPNPTLTASYGPPIGYFSDGIFPEDELNLESFWGAGISVSVPIFQGGSAANAVFAARAQVDAAKYSLESAALNAVRGVENALVLEDERARQREATDEQLAAARVAYQAAAEQYRVGLTTFVNVQTAQQTLLQAELSALQAHRDQIDARVQLYAALGAATGNGGSR